MDGKRVGRVTTEHFGAKSILRRNSYTMDQCTNDLPLAQKSRDGRVMMVNVMNPCWIYRGLDLGAVKGFDIAVAPLPFNFQLMHDVKKIPLYPRAARGGQLEIRMDGCTGKRLAVLPLPKGRANLHAAVKPQSGIHDVCLLFARRGVDPVWAIAWVQPRKE
jgi:hexosaminidase